MQKSKGTSVEYRWKPQMRGRTKVPAEVFGNTLEALRKKHGGEIHDGLIVDAARSPASPIHPLFEWNDKAAGEEYRKEQAGYYRRHFVIIVQAPKRRGEKAKEVHRIAYVSLKKKDGSSVHRDAVEVMTSGEYRMEAVWECTKLLMGIRRRFAHLTEMGEVFAVIDQTVVALGKSGDKATG